MQILNVLFSSQNFPHEQKKKNKLSTDSFCLWFRKQKSYESFFLSGIFIIHISQIILPARMSQKQTEIAMCHLVNELKNIPQKQTNKRKPQNT